ncbi:hypothetical protein [Sorangium sp. So ce1000]|uniref:hypothetical protein n=1 Tax=Sorangium sp. So ce1000 TaxID=3133325 RepID=UPI003F610727
MNPSAERTGDPAAPDLPVPIELGLELSRRYFPAAAARMRAALPVLLHPLLAAGDAPVGWGPSLLTDGGYPFEFTFTTRNDGIRYTLEVAPPRQKPGSRLARALEVLRELGCASFDEEGLTLVRRAQAGGTLRYGAWVGVHHHEGGSSHKVYAEVAPQGEEAAMAWLNPRLCRPVGAAGRSITLQMIGWRPATGELEFYFRVRDLRPWELSALMHPLGLESCDKLLFEMLQKVYGRPLFQRLPGPVFGFSYALPPGGQPAAAATRRFTFYSLSETMFGDDAAARRKLMRYFHQLGCDMSYYAEMSAPAARSPGRRTHHGMFGVTVGEGVEPVSHIGLRPPGGGLHAG